MRHMDKPTQQVAFRLPASLVERVDEFARQMSEAQPGFVASRTDAARVLLTQALDGAERKKRKTR